MTKMKNILAIAGLSILLLAIVFSAGCTDSGDGRDKITVKGYVTIKNYGDPLEDVEVEIIRYWYDKSGRNTRAWMPAEDDKEATVKTDSAGFYSAKVPKLIEGEWYSVHVSYDGYFGNGGSFEDQYQAKTNWVNCTLRTMSDVSGTVSDSSGNPVENALVVLCVDYENLDTKTDVRRTTYTDADGDFIVYAADDGVYDVLAYKEGYEVGVVDKYDTHTEVVPEPILTPGGSTPGDATIFVQHEWTNDGWVGDRPVVLLFDYYNNICAMFEHDNGKMEKTNFSVEPGTYYVNVHCDYLDTDNSEAIKVEVTSGTNATVTISGKYNPPVDMDN